MPKQEDDKPIVLYPMTFEETLGRMLKTPAVNLAKRKKRQRQMSKKQTAQRGIDGPSKSKLHAA